VFCKNRPPACEKFATYGESCSPTSGGQRPAESTRGRIFEFPFQETGGHARESAYYKDSDFSVVSSFNWLSFKGDPNRTFRDEQGLKVQDANFIARKFDELLPRFTLRELAPGRCIEGERSGPWKTQTTEPSRDTQHASPMFA
jgi:hypothetical protein